MSKFDLKEYFAKRLTEREGSSRSGAVDALSAVTAGLQTWENINNRKVQDIRNDSAIIGNYNSRMENLLNNNIASNKMYTDEGIANVREAVSNFSKNYISQFPELTSEFNDSETAIIAKLNKNQDLNREYDKFIKDFSDAENKLVKHVDFLSNVKHEDMTASDRNNYRNEILKDIEDVLNMENIVNNPYFTDKNYYCLIHMI